MDEPVSKSQKKREAQVLQKFGVQLIALSADKLDLLALPDTLRRAINEAKSIKSHGALRRQMQLIGKLMRAADNEAIFAAYEDIMAEGSAKTAAFHDVEQWRSRLIAEGKDALNEFISQHPQVDTQQLRQLIKKAVAEQNNEKSTGAGKSLFRFLRSYL